MAAIAGSASCGGGGASSPTPSQIVATGAPSHPGSSAEVRITLTWPTTYVKPSDRRRRSYLSNSTASVAIAVGGTTTTVNNPNLTPGTTSATTQATTVVDVPAPVGADTFLVGDYDASGGTGNLLAQNSIPFTVVAGTLNTVDLTLNGNLGQVVCAPVAPFVTGTKAAYTQVGPTGQVMLLPEDADGNIIIAPGAVPALTLSADTTKATITSTSTPDEFNTNLLVSNTPVTLTGSGTNLAGATVTGTCTDTRVPALYVTNYSTEALDPSITIYPASANGDATPIAKIAGSNTAEHAIQFPAVDAQGNLFVTNAGPMPGTVFSPTSGYVAIYSPGAGQTGNVAPAAYINGFDTPEGISIDPSGNVYVVSIDRIQKFPASADGVTAPAAATNVITGAATQLQTCYGLDVTATTIYTTCTPYPFYIETFPIATTGNVAPATQITFVGAVAAAGMTVSYSTVSWLSVGVDSTGTMYAPDTNNNENAVYGFAAGTTGMSVPTTIAKIGFNLPSSVFVDSADEIYVANYGSNSIEMFANATDLVAGNAAATISGADTGLTQPLGIYVR